ncbi:MAG: sugar transferase, partial [Prochlorothrix sp.]
MASNSEASSQSADASADAKMAIAEIQMPSLFSAAEAVAVKQQVEAACQQMPRPDTIVLDFSPTTFMDSSGIGSLVRCHSLVEQQGLQLLLTHVSPTVMMALSLTELDRVLNIVSADQLEGLTLGSQGAGDASIESSSNSRSPVVMTHPSVHSKIKRLMDITGACLGLGVTALLIFPIVATAIKLEDGGPIFFGQVRCSWLGRRFRMWKFRSMVVNAELIKHTVENKAQGSVPDKTLETPTIQGFQT